MSTDSDKPFHCQFPGCGQRFANHDHLTQHQQKHDLSLKFKGGDISLIDQTPTPTRFLRTCEESGLFQELEEANPFEQDFKDATPTGSSTKQPLTTSQSAPSNTKEKPPKVTEVVAQTVVEPLPRVSSVATATIPVAPPASLINPDKPVAMASAPAHVSTASALTKQKLLQNIQMKEQQKLLENVLNQQLGSSSSHELLAQALKNFIPQVQVTGDVDSDQGDQEENDPLTNKPVFLVPTDSPGRRKRGRKPDDEDPEVKRQRFLERNRAAASRCRAKKKQWVDNLEKKAKDMESMNSGLQQEVLMLRSEVQQLKSILIAHKDCPLIVHHTKEGVEGGDRSGEGGVTLLAQLANMPSMSPLITSPVPSVGSVVPNNTPPSMLTQQHTQSLPTTIVITTNGLAPQAPEVAKDVEIAAEVDQHAVTAVDH